MVSNFSPRCFTVLFVTQPDFYKGNQRLKLSLSSPWGHKEGVEIQLHSFSTSALDECDRSTSRLGRFTSEKDSSIPWTGDFVSLRACVDVSENRKIFCFFRDSNLRPSSLYRSHSADWTVTPPIITKSLHDFGTSSYLNRVMWLYENRFWGYGRNKELSFLTELLFSF